MFLLPTATASSPRPILTPVPRILSPERLDNRLWSCSVFRISADVVIRFLKVSANIRIMVKQSASWSSSVPSLTPETQCASAYCQLLHTTITRSCTTVRFKQTVSPGSSNYTTIASVGPRSNHSGVESLPKASPLRCLCLSFTDLFLSPPPLFHVFSPWIYLIPSSQLYS